MNWYTSSYTFSSSTHNSLLKYTSPTLIQWLEHSGIAGRCSIYCYITQQSDHGQFLYSGQSVWQRNYHVYKGFNLGSMVHSNVRVEVRLTDKSTTECQNLKIPGESYKQAAGPELCIIVGGFSLSTARRLGASGSVATPLEAATLEGPHCVNRPRPVNHSSVCSSAPVSAVSSYPEAHHTRIYALTLILRSYIRLMQVRASVDLMTVPVEVRRKRRAVEHMSRQEREAVADIILGVGKGEETHTFVDLLARALIISESFFIAAALVGRWRCMTNVQKLQWVEKVGCDVPHREPTLRDAINI